jgi:arginyl-tRNA synthetase
LLAESIQKLFPEVELTEKLFHVDVSPIGDYRTSTAFQLSQKSKKKPADVAKMLVESIKGSTLQHRKALSEIEATGPGFVSFTFNTSWIVHQSIHELMPKIKAIRSAPRRVVIDHGSPNMSKEFHVGHLRSIMIGDCLARVLRYQGHHVDTVSHVGDYGTPMGLVIAHAMRTRSWAFEPPASDSLPSPSELSQLYTEAKLKQKTDPELASLIVHCVTEIQKLDSTTADPHVMRVYNQICEASRAGFNDVYKDLGVDIPEKGESFYGQFIPETIEDLKGKGLVTESEGALVCRLESWKAPLIVEKSDQTWLYGTTDLAALRYRTQNYDDLLYVVDFTQHQHFEQVYEVARKAGWYDPSKTRVEHVHFGVVQGSNGQKLSSRDGTPLKLRQLLDDAIVETRAALITARSLVRSDRQDQDVEPASVDEKLAEPTRFGNLDSSQAYISPASRALAEENAPVVAFNAIKYFELSQTRTQNYIFSFQSMLSFKGNTSFYIIYAYARIHTLYRRAAEQGVSVPELTTNESAEMTEEELNAVTSKERDLALKLLQFADVVRSVEVSLMPHTLSAHLFQTSQKFHSFYENCRVIGSTNQDFRLRLCKATEQILGKGLELLNVHTVDHV